MVAGYAAQEVGHSVFTGSTVHTKPEDLGIIRNESGHTFAGGKAKNALLRTSDTAQNLNGVTNLGLCHDRRLNRLARDEITPAVTHLAMPPMASHRLDSDHSSAI